MKVRPSQVGKDLATDLIARAEESVETSHERAEVFGVDPARYILEKILLEVWASELSVSQALGMSSSYRSEILDSFYQTLVDLASQRGWRGILHDVEMRNEAYTVAYNNPHKDPKLGRHWSIAKRFSVHCNAEMNPQLIIVGAELYLGVLGATVPLVAEWHKRFS